MAGTILNDEQDGPYIAYSPGPRYRQTPSGFAQYLALRFEVGTHGNNFGKNQVAILILRELADFVDKG